MQEQRLRRPFPCTALTCQNVLPDALSGRVSGTARLSRLAGYAGWDLRRGIYCGRRHGLFCG
jgi:hypothetical protein